MNEISRSAPPQCVPTLTEVVRPDQGAAPQNLPTLKLPTLNSSSMALPLEFANLLDGWPSNFKASQPADPGIKPLEPALCDRIVSRLELALASGLQASIDSVVDAQMREFKLALHAQITSTLLAAVKQAVQQETDAPRPDTFQR